jgi:hypothetical protein
MGSSTRNECNALPAHQRIQHFIRPGISVILRKSAASFDEAGKFARVLVAHSGPPPVLLHAADCPVNPHLQFQFRTSCDERLRRTRWDRGTAYQTSSKSCRAEPQHPWICSPSTFTCAMSSAVWITWTSGMLNMLNIPDMCHARMRVEALLGVW